MAKKVTSLKTVLLEVEKVVMTDKEMSAISVENLDISLVTVRTLL